ncbi:MAG TPA: hypothetical protein VFQ37_05730 [Mycobacterium sp.]|nr:hypothetical protein [Mycobacterium sp.]
MSIKKAFIVGAAGLGLGLFTAGVAYADPWTVEYDENNVYDIGKGGYLDTAQFFNGSTTLLGGDIVTKSFLGGVNDLFFADAGLDSAGKTLYDVYDQSQIIPGLLTNLYYAPAGGSIIDILKTPFGNFNISSLAFLFTPPSADSYIGALEAGDYTHVADPSALFAHGGIFSDAGLYSALDLGLPASTAAEGVGSLLGGVDPSDLLGP